MAVQIQTRNDTAANWAATNPVLAEGEQGYDSDAKRFKIGDGSTAWADLPWVNDVAGAAAQALTDSKAYTDTTVGTAVAAGTAEAHDYTNAKVAAHAAASDPHGDRAYAAAQATAAETAAKAYADAQVAGLDSAAAATYIPLTQRGAADGVATLDGAGKVPTAQMPPLAITDVFPVASEAAMLALTAQVGDIAIRSDQSKSYILGADPASTLANWHELLTPPAPVLSVDGRVGVVSLADLYAAKLHASTHSAGGTDPISVALSQLLAGAATAGQLVGFDGTAWGPVNAPSSQLDPGFVSNLTGPMGNSTQNFGGASTGTIYTRILNSGSVSKIGVWIGATTSGAATIHLSIYSNTGTGRNAAPLNRLATTGAITIPSGTLAGYYEYSIGTTLAVTAGMWFSTSVVTAVVGFNSTTRIIPNQAANNVQPELCRYQAATTPPATAGSFTTSSNFAPPVLLGTP